MIVLFTDFGLEGPYTGQVEAVLYRQAPGIPVVRLCSDLAPFDIEAAAYLLPAYAAGFAPGDVFVAVVDPGVGGSRQGVVLQADGRWFVGPDAGLFSLVARRARAVAAWRLPAVRGAAPSFHGRDVFAPAAACLARDGRLPDGCEAHVIGLRSDWPDDLARIVYIDRYGNAVTGLRATAVAESATLNVQGHAVGHARTFSAVGEGEAFWYANANGLVEIAVNRGHAGRVLDLQVGTPVAR